MKKIELAGTIYFDTVTDSEGKQTYRVVLSFQHEKNKEPFHAIPLYRLIDQENAGIWGEKVKLTLEPFEGTLKGEN